MSGIFMSVLVVSLTISIVVSLINRARLVLGPGPLQVRRRLIWINTRVCPESPALARVVLRSQVMRSKVSGMGIRGAVGAVWVIQFDLIPIFGSLIGGTTGRDRLESTT